MAQIFMQYKDIQNYLNEHYIKTQKKASLFDAIFTLYKKKMFSYRSNYQNSSHQITSISDLYHLMTQTPIDVSSIINQPDWLYKNVSESYFMFLKRDARSMLQFQNEQTYLHKHDYFEIDFILQGQIKFTCFNQVQSLYSGNLIIISPNAQHKIEVTDDSVVICIAIKKSTFNDTFFSLLKNDNSLTNFFNQSLYSSHKNYLVFLVKITPEILSTLQNIYLESYSSQNYANEICCSYISIFFSYTLRYLLQQNTYERNSPNVIVSILNEIKSNYKQVELASLAKQFNYDKDYLGKLILNNTGQSFNQLRNYYRIQQSCQLLKFTDSNIKSISEEVGYNSPNHFERCFTQLKGISPTTYRKRSNKNIVN